MKSSRAALVIVLLSSGWSRRRDKHPPIPRHLSRGSHSRRYERTEGGRLRLMRQLQHPQLYNLALCQMITETKRIRREDRLQTYSGGGQGLDEGTVTP